MLCGCTPQQTPYCIYLGQNTTNFIYFHFDKYQPFCSKEWSIPNPIPEKSILVSFSVKVNAWKKGKMKISKKLNGILTSSIIDEDDSLPCWGTYGGKALEYGFDEEQSNNVFYYGNYISSQDGSSPTYIEYYKEPVVAKAGKQFLLEVYLYNSEYDPFLKVDCLWSITNGGGKGTIKDITFTNFTIAMVAPDILDNSRSIKLTLKYKYVNPDDGSVKSLGT